MHAEPSLPTTQPLWTPTSGANVLRPDVRRFAGYDAVRIILGFVLLTAAALKGYQLATEPVAETSLLTSRWFLIGVVEFELFFGLWLLAGIYPKPTWAAALLCFGGFACISLYKAVSGEASCGCFGKLPVNPWYTFAGDVAAILAPLRWRPSASMSRRGLTAGDWSSQAVVVGLAWLMIGAPVALAIVTFRPALLEGGAHAMVEGGTVLLRPDKWVGQQFPLIRYIDIGEELMQGEWLVVLYHHDCSKCEATVSRYTQPTFGRTNQATFANIALVELPPYGDALKGSIDLGSPCLVARLRDVADWVVTTPVEVILQNGTVVEVL